MDALDCRREDRRKKLFNNANWNGIDFLEVADDQMSLCVHFFGQVPANVAAANVRITGGRRITDIGAVMVEINSAHDPDLDDCLRITLDKFGDFSTYQLCLVDPPTGKAMAGLDPRYACLDFTFKIACPSDLDCKPDCGCPPEVLPEPDINYLAKDYASFRQIILDRLALVMPDWRERHVPDIGITLVELFAYVGDYLSYYQDAVSTEAYLETARERISVRRHARLVDYRMHEGCNARAWVTVATGTDIPSIALKDFYFIIAFSAGEVAGIISETVLEEVPAEVYEVFEPQSVDAQTTVVLLQAHSTIRFHCWGDLECCLAKGATCATLIDMAPPSTDPPPPLPGGSRTTPAGAPAAEPPALLSAAPASVSEPVPVTPTNGMPTTGTPPARILSLKVGEVLIFEEVIGPGTGNPADADPRHRHAVRLTSVTQGMDGLLGIPIVEIAWGAEDALPFSLCQSVRLPSPDCRWIGDVSVARGNVVLVDHGRTVREPLGPVGTIDTLGACSCEGSVVEETVVPAPFRPGLTKAPLVFAEPLAPGASASALFRRDPRKALPCLALEELVGASASGPFWTVCYDLLESGPDDRDFAAEIDDAGNAQRRFGDGALGRQPEAGLSFDATYRIGTETQGNVGRDTITYLVMRNGTLSEPGIAPRNPLPAAGGTAREPVADVKLLAPFAFRDIRERAITADDYAQLAERSPTVSPFAAETTETNPAVQRAAAELDWMGSWYEAHVAIDPEHSEIASPQLLSAVDAYLHAYRRIGHDLCVVPAQYVPLSLVLEVCVLPDYSRGQVEAQLIKIFGTGQLANGTLGFFNPDNLTFGEGIYLSRIVAAARAAPGVVTVKIKSFHRLNSRNESALNSGVLPLASFEVAMCDSDPNFPENGGVVFIMGGGR